MISAAAALILGVNQKHAALSDRVRTLAAEFRAPATSVERRESIRAQVRFFDRRLAYAATAPRWLRLAVACFVGMVLVITLTARSFAWDRIALSLFLSGIALVLAAVVAELLELRLAGQTIHVEMRDVLGKESES